MSLQLEEIDFKAADARRIMEEGKRKKEFVHHKFHAQIVNLIRHRASKQLNHARYRIPSYLFGQQIYDPKNIMIWLIERLESDGFKVNVDFQRQELYISWERPSAKPLTKRRRTKSVRFDLNKNLFHKI